MYESWILLVMLSKADKVHLVTDLLLQPLAMKADQLHEYATYGAGSKQSTLDDDHLPCMQSAPTSKKHVPTPMSNKTT